jgi:thioesterase domain-containing protein
VAAEYVASIRTVQREGPYFLVGSCDGALVAFEMVRRLEAEGHRVATLAIVDTWPLENSSIYPLVMLKMWRRGWDARSPAERRALLRRKAAELLSRGATILRPRPEPRAPAVSGARELSEEERQAVWRARLWPGRGFRPPVIDAPIAVLRVREQPYWRVRDDTLGWRERTRGAVTVHVLPGDHFTWSRPPNVAHFSRTLAAYLGAAAPVPPGRGP